MNKKVILSLIASVVIVVGGFYVYPRLFSSAPERKIIYWTDPMLPGDRSDHPGKSPMGMERIPVFSDEAEKQNTSQEKSYYTCPMHPSIRKDRSGACPVCGMALVKKIEDDGMSNLDGDASHSVSISPSRQILANVSTSVAQRKSLHKEIHAVGRVDYAEPNFRRISTRFPGRLDTLYLTYTGQKVNKGDPVAEVYSPEAISAQQEYLLAKDSYDQDSDATEMIATGAKALLEQSHEKLLRWGFTDGQLQELERTKEVKKTLTIYSPISGTVLKKNVDPQHYTSAGEDIYDVADLSTVWINFDVYEYEMQFLKMGQSVETTTDAYPGAVFAGTITFISPTLDAASRTIRVRAELPNPQEALKPEMFVSATITIKLPSTIILPSSAVISTGKRDIVWVQNEKGKFELRVVNLGTRTDDQVQILHGILPGDVVVTSGGYLIDSESQLQTSK